MGLVLREAHSGDYGAIARLTVAVYVGERFSPAESTPSLENIKSRVEASTVLVAEDNDSGEIVGVVSLVLNDGPLGQLLRDDEAEIRLLAVGSAARGRGAGEALSRECVSRALLAGKERVVLSAQPSMSAARRVYERLGFAREADRDWVTADGRPMLAYTLELSTTTAEEVGLVSLADVELLHELALEADREGHTFVSRMISEWSEGANCFDARGEQAYVAQLGERVIGVCGLNIDPYGADATVGRVRHLYVLPEYRRANVGTLLLERIVEEAGDSFQLLRLRTRNPEAAAFYRSRGFAEVVGDEFCTHARDLTAPMSD